MAVGPIEHLVVLMLENRSFDHMLGFLDHPDPRFDRLRDNPENYTNPEDPLDPGSPRTPVSDDADHTSPIDPPHSQSAIAEQMGVRADGRPRMDGFVAACGRHSSAERHEVMKCMAPEKVPVLSTLAMEFAVCTNWFCSVPGSTWPNRSFAHAATSEHFAELVMRLYNSRTVFELIEPQATWSIYHDGRCQSWAFPSLWRTPERRARWHPISDFEEHVGSGRLANYVFVEPDQFGADSRCQHPNNNRTGTAGADFLRAEQLIAHLYAVLKDNPEVFDRTLLVILYDEHGGFYDHVPPPAGVPVPGPVVSEDVPPSSPEASGREHKEPLPLGMLGPRVPAVVVSPRIGSGTLDDRIYEHSSIPATARALFCSGAGPLTERDAAANTFHHLVSLETGRRDLPELRPLPLPAGAVPGVGPRRFEDELTILLQSLGDRLLPELRRLASGGRTQGPTAESAAARGEAATAGAARTPVQDDELVGLFRAAADKARREL